MLVAALYIRSIFCSPGVGKMSLEMYNFKNHIFVTHQSYHTLQYHFDRGWIFTKAMSLLVYNTVA